MGARIKRRPLVINKIILFKAGTLVAVKCSNTVAYLENIFLFVNNPLTRKMKNNYLHSLKPGWTGRLWALVALLWFAPLLGLAQSLSFTPQDPNQSPGGNSSTNPQYFGQVGVGAFSASKSYVIAGSDLAPNTNVSIVIPSNFQGSVNNTSFSTSTITLTTDGTGTLASTIVYLRFAPTGGAGTTINRTVFAQANDADGAPVLSSPVVRLRGDAVAGSPSIVIDKTSLSFGNQQVNNPSAPMMVRVDATSLTNDITVTAPAGFQVSYNGSAYATTATISQGSGTVDNAVVNVRFLPTAARDYVGNITFVSNGAGTRSTGVSGTGILPAPDLTVAPTDLNFGTTTVGLATASQSFDVSGSSLQGDVTVTAPTGFQIRTGAGFFSASPITLTPTNGALANTTIDVRFVPGGAQAYDANVVVSTPNNATVTTRQVRVTGTATQSSGNATIVVNPGALNFGTITSSGSANNQTFEVSGTDLTNNIVLTPSSPNIEIRNASLNGTFSKGPITLSRTGTTVSPQTIEVRLVSLIAQGPFNQRIDLTSGATATQVTITGNNTTGTTSDISVSSPNQNAFTFATRPNTVSAPQSFLLAGTNLVQPLVVEPIGPNSQFFEISETANGPYVRSLSFQPNSQGNVLQRSIYVRFIPGNLPLNVTSTIRNSSAPAPNFDVSVTGISEPTIRLSNIVGNFPDNVVKGTTSAPRPVTVEGFLLTGDVDIRFPADLSDAERNPAQTPLFEFSRNNGGLYVKETTVTPDADGNFSLPLQVRYAPVRVGNAAQELQFRNPSFNDNNYFALNSGFGRTNGFSIAIEPMVQLTARVARSANRTSAVITFDLAASQGYGQNRLVIASSTYLNELPTTLFPQDKQNFNPGTTTNGAYVFGTGTVIESSSDTYVVFSGSSQIFTVTSLDPNKEYKFFSFEFNNDGVLNAENYLTPNNEPQTPLPVTLVSFSAKVSGSQVAIRWETASELNNKQFTVERSRDSRTFETILTRAGQGTTNATTVYNEVDRQPLNGVSYYRLKQVDLDGKTSYSNIASVSLLKAGEVVMYPNPVANVLTITMNGGTESVSVTITDLSGRMVQTQQLRADGKVDMANLKAGTYLVTVGKGDTKVTRRVVKQ